MFKQYLFSRPKRLQQISATLVILTVAIIGTLLLIGSHAATPYASINADKGTQTCGASAVPDSTASDGNKVVFGGCGGTTMLTATTIPLSAAEIPNDMRGQYFWDGSPAEPSGWPLSDVYYRLSYLKWNQIETSPGVYDFSTFDAGLRQAQAAGYKFGFRIIAFNPGGGGNTKPLPAWINTEPNTDAYTGQSSPMPAWNDTSSNGFLTAYANLMNAIANHITPVANGVGGVRLADDPRLGWVDMGGYGDWGEWHTYNQSGTPITDANMQSMEQSVVNAFPNTYTLAMDDSTTWLNQAMGLKAPSGMTAKVGIRSDCLGTSWGGGLQNLGLVNGQPSNTGDAAANNRWQTAPVVTEWCAAGETYAYGLSQVAAYHISLLSSDNHPNLSSTDPTLGLADKTSGYRYQIDSATLPSQVTPGAPFNLSSNWENVGVAPTYQPWNVQFQLRNSAGQVSWSGQSSINLKTLFNPIVNQTNPPTPGKTTVNDQFTVPSSLAAGTYTLATKVVDPSNYLAPMNLADQVRTSDGAYPLGAITVK
jgi:hypothetical protein